VSEQDGEVTLEATETAAESAPEHSPEAPSTAHPPVETAEVLEEDTLVLDIDAEALAAVAAPEDPADAPTPVVGEAEVAAAEAAPAPEAPAPESADAVEAAPLDRRLECLLAVRRSVAWAGRQDKGAPHLRFIGAASLRLLGPYAEEPALEALVRALEAIDGAPVRSRRRLLGRVRRAADDLLGEHAPKRRKRRPKRSEAPRSESKRSSGRRGDRRSAADKPRAPAATEPRAEEGVVEAAPAREAAPDPTDDSGRNNRKRRRGRRRGGREDEPVKAAPPAEPVVSKPVVRPLGHPMATGRAVAELGVLDEVELEALTEAGIHTIADLLQRAPSRHERSQRVGVAGAVLDEPVTVRAPILWRVVHLSPHGRRWEVGLGDADAPPLRVRWFRSQPRGWEHWEVGQELGLHGEVREAEAGPTMYEAEPLGLRGRGSGMLPVYGIDGIDDTRVRATVAAALEEVENTLSDWLPAAIRDQHRLLALDEALRDAHFPANATRRGRLRLAFDELFTIQVGVAWRSGRGKPARGIAHKPVHMGIGQIEAQHQIRLDDAQELAFSEIRRDLVRPVPMNRLLQGDVGSGKGLVAQLAALMVVGGGCQAAMVAPDSLAAERRFLHIDPILRSIGIKTLLITDDRLDRAQIDAIRRGEAQIVFGTRAILQKAVTWKRLGLVTVEERGTFGSLDLEALARRGTRPDLLVIPRAPIPSSLAFTVFGDFDVSTLHASTPRHVACGVFANTDRQEAYAPLREVIASGRQGYVVFPVRDGRDLLSVEDAMRTARALQTDLLPGARVGVYSSEMSREERGRVFEDFQHRRIDVLVCTTYIEDSPAVTNATAMVVEYADLHDLVRLHRLRSHVSGGYKAGVCSFVTSDNPGDNQAERLDQLVRERDGFRLAELDLRFRGASAILGDRATEAPIFSWADPPEDRGLFMRARQAAFDLIRRDPELRSAGGVAATVNLRWGDWLGQALPRVSAKKRNDGRRRRRKRR